MDGLLTTDNTIRVDGTLGYNGTSAWSDMSVYPNTYGPLTIGGKTNMNASPIAVPAVGGFRPQIRTMSGEVLWEGHVVRRHDKAVRAATKHLNTKLTELLNA